MNLIIDGFPKTLDQALYFEKNIMKINNIIFFDCPIDVMI